jgi:hypothetical protein
VYTVVVRFHHPNRDLDEIEDDLRAAGADDALVTGYTVAMSIDAGSHKEATKAARQILDGFGATRIKITKRGARHGGSARLPVG